MKDENSTENVEIPQVVVSSTDWLDCPLCEEKPDWWGAPEKAWIIIQCETCDSHTSACRTFQEAEAEWNKVKNFTEGS
jgi:hypothetical protein